jgi:hypothetical protein
MATGCGQGKPKDYSEMPKEYLAEKAPPIPEFVRVPPGATAATMPDGSEGLVHWTSIHVDESHKTWLDPDAKVIAGYGSISLEEVRQYLSLRKYDSTDYSVSLDREPPFKWMPAPIPKDKHFIRVTLIVPFVENKSK